MSSRGYSYTFFQKGLGDSRTLTRRRRPAVGTVERRQNRKYLFAGRWSRLGTISSKGSRIKYTYE